MIVNLDKNRKRDPFSFANINLLGKCNVRCYFCLGEDIRELLSQHNQLKTPFTQWKNFDEFIARCRKYDIKKIYVTGQNTDSLLYEYLDELVEYLHKEGFGVGLRTNGYMAPYWMDTINKCDLSVGYSIHSLTPLVNKMILGVDGVPEWDKIIPATKNCRVQIVVTRCNRHEVLPLIRKIAEFKNVKYIQLRRVSTETRVDILMPDMVAYEQTYTLIREAFPLKGRLWQDAEIYEIAGKDVCMWRTVKTSVNSINYFTDGTLSDEYFIVEGYLRHHIREV